MKAGKNSLTLVALDIEGQWNVPLLRNAAEMSGASVVFGRAALPADATAIGEGPAPPFEDLLDQYDHVLACETARNSRNVYALPAPRGRTAVLVGNELSGIPGEVLSASREVVSVPMHGKGMTSVNVAVAAAIVLYALERDLARTGIRKSRLPRSKVDVLIRDPDDPSELGSLLRSVWVFGWRKVYLSDRRGVWFTRDRAILAASRAAARREVNPLVVAPAEQVNLQKYRSIILCSSDRAGTALSRFAFPELGPTLLVFGEGDPPPRGSAALSEAYVDYSNAKARGRFRHTGSILLSVTSEMLRGDRRG